MDPASGALIGDFGGGVASGVQAVEPATTTRHDGLGGGGRENLTTGRQASGAQVVEPAAAARLGDLGGGVRD